MSDLKLIALDAEDLAAMSAHVQDAVLKVEDMTYLPRERRFVALINRFDWAETHAARRRWGRPDRRRRAALRIERVAAAKLMGVDLKARGRVLSMLAVTFTPGVSPAGVVEIVLAGGGGYGSMSTVSKLR